MHPLEGIKYIFVARDVHLESVQKFSLQGKANIYVFVYMYTHTKIQ